MPYYYNIYCIRFLKPRTTTNKTYRWFLTPFPWVFINSHYTSIMFLVLITHPLIVNAAISFTAKKFITVRHNVMHDCLHAEFHLEINLSRGERWVWQPHACSVYMHDIVNKSGSSAGMSRWNPSCMASLRLMGMQNSDNCVFNQWPWSSTSRMLTLTLYSTIS